MNNINFNQVGGFPMTTNILGKMQTAYSLFNAFGNIVGDKTIISGCTVTGANTSDGVVFVDGETFEFRGGATQTKVIIKEDAGNLVFQNENSYPSIKNRYVTFGTGVGAIDWVNFKRGFATKDIVAGLAAKADKNAFDALAAAFTLVFEKMLTIDVGAEKNVQPNYTQTDSTADDFIKNKPGTINFIAKGTFAIGDVTGSDNIRTVPFADVGTNNYMVVGCMVSTGSNYDLDNDVIWMVREKSNISFKLTLREFAGVVQNLSFEYMLIPL